MPSPVSLDDLMRIMREFSLELQDQIASFPIQLSIPVDGQGVRVKVSVPPGYRSRIPETVTFTLDGKPQVISLEAEEDYQDYEPLSSDHTSLRRA